MSQQSQRLNVQRESHDTVCVGFGTTGLSLAVALRERNPDASVVFLERQPKSTWRSIAHLPGHDSMKVSFMSDLVTYENPRSKFIFLKFLHARNLLVNFTNVGKTRPSRELYLEYLRWCADYFESVVRYGNEVSGVEPVRQGSNKVESWKVLVRDKQTGQRSVLHAKRVVVAVGQQPKLPAVFSVPTVGSSVVHSSESMDLLEKLVCPKMQASSIAIAGDGQQAAEIFDYLHTRRTQHQVIMFMERKKLVPGADCQTDMSANNPTDVPTISHLPPELRAQASNRETTPQLSDTSSVADDLLYRLFEHEYAQSVKQPDSSKWQYQIHTSHRLSCAARLPDGRLCLAFTNTLNNATYTFPQAFDLIIAATGYDQLEHKRLISPLAKAGLLESPHNKITVDGHYQLNLRKKTIKNGRGVWLASTLGQQAEENILPILAERSRRLVDSLMAVGALENLEDEDPYEQAEVQARL